MTIVHIDSRDGSAYLPGMPAMMMDGNSVRNFATLAHSTPNTQLRSDLTLFSFNYTFVLNIVFAAITAWLWWQNRRNPMEHGSHVMSGHKMRPM